MGLVSRNSSIHGSAPNGGIRFAAVACWVRSFAISLWKLAIGTLLKVLEFFGQSNLEVLA